MMKWIGEREREGGTLLQSSDRKKILQKVNTAFLSSSLSSWSWFSSSSSSWRWSSSQWPDKTHVDMSCMQWRSVSANGMSNRLLPTIFSLQMHCNIEMHCIITTATCHTSSITPATYQIISKTARGMLQKWTWSKSVCNHNFLAFIGDDGDFFYSEILHIGALAQNH